MSTQTSIPPCPTEPNSSYVSRLILNSGGAAGSLTVTTGGGSENWCTFHMATAPTPTATTATKGIQTRAKTVLPGERGLTPSPSGIRSQTSCSRFAYLGHISTRLRYGGYDTTSLRRNASKGRRYHLLVQSAARKNQRPTHRNQRNGSTTCLDLLHKIFRRRLFNLMLRRI